LRGVGSARWSVDPVHSRGDLLRRAPGRWQPAGAPHLAVGPGRLLARPCPAVEILRRAAAGRHRAVRVDEPPALAMVPRTGSLHRLRDRDPALRPGADLELAERVDLVRLSGAAGR